MIQFEDKDCLPGGSIKIDYTNVMVPLRKSRIRHVKAVME